MNRPYCSTVRRVFVVEDHPIFRDGLVQVINREPDLKVCGTADTVVTARAAIALRQPDIVIVDLSLRDADGLGLISDLHRSYPRLPCLVLSMHDEALYVDRVLAAGGRGYIMKHEPAANVLAAVRRVLAGEIAVSDACRSRLLSRLVGGQRSTQRRGVDLLNRRQLQVFRLIARGLTTHQIARRLNLSKSTVETYRAQIKGMLGLRTANDLLRYAVKWADASGEI